VGSRVEDNDILANGGDGIEVSGGSATLPNVLFKNSVGDAGTGNLGNGISIHDDIGNGVADPVELKENVVRGKALWASLSLPGPHAMNCRKTAAVVLPATITVAASSSWQPATSMPPVTGPTTSVFPATTARPFRPNVWVRQVRRNGLLAWL
jgi:hypothetical protein